MYVHMYVRMYVCIKSTYDGFSIVIVMYIFACVYV